MRRHAPRATACFNADPTVGGRYSALTAFGLVPTGLAGVDISELLDEAEATLLEVAIDSADNPALVLAAAIAGGQAGELRRRDKLGLITDGTHIVGLPDWIEQLVAESTGKEGTGILPVVLLPVSPEVENTPADLQIVRIVDEANEFHFRERHEGEVLISGSLGAQLVVWEYATAIAGRMLGINPFDQPDVESAKIAARGLLDARPEADRACIRTSTASRCGSPTRRSRHPEPSPACSTHCGLSCPRTATCRSRRMSTGCVYRSCRASANWSPPTPGDLPPSAGDRGSCTRPANSTRAAQRSACSCRSWKRPTSTSRSRTARSRSGS